MRKTLFIFCSVLSFFLFSFSASAAVPALPSQYFTVNEDGDTVLYVDTAGNLWDDSRRDFLRKWVSSDRRLLSINDQDIRFTILPSSFKFPLFYNNTVSLSTDDVVNDPIQWLPIRHYVPSIPYVWPSQISSHSQINIGTIIPGDYCKIDLSSVALDSIYSYAGKLILKDTAGIFAPLAPLPPPPPEPEPEPEPEPLPPAPPIDTSLIALQQPYVDAGYRLINTNIGKIINAAVIVMLWVSFMVLAIRLIAEIGGSA